MRSPSTRREWIEISCQTQRNLVFWSPSTRREWIEITDGVVVKVDSFAVSLHTEGVD